MDELLRFLGVMSALSASSQTMTMQLKKRFRWLKLDKPADEDDDVDLVSFKEGKFHANVHLVCGINGTILAALGNIHPLSFLGIKPIWEYASSPLIANGIDYVTAGVLVAYGGPWFHEVFGIVREYKKSLRGSVS